MRKICILNNKKKNVRKNCVNNIFTIAQELHVLNMVLNLKNLYEHIKVFFVQK